MKALRIVRDRFYRICAACLTINDNSTYSRGVSVRNEGRCSAAIMSRTCRCKIRENRHAAGFRPLTSGERMLIFHLASCFERYVFLIA